MATLRAPYGRGTVTVSKESAERFKAAGWVEVKESAGRKRPAKDSADEK